MQNIIPCVAGDKTRNIRNSCRAVVHFFSLFAAEHKTVFASIDTVDKSTVEIDRVFCFLSDMSAKSGVVHSFMYSTQTGAKSIATSFSPGWLDLHRHQGGNRLHPLSSIHFQARETSINWLSCSCMRTGPARKCRNTAARISFIQ